MTCDFAGVAVEPRQLCFAPHLAQGSLQGTALRLGVVAGPRRREEPDHAGDGDGALSRRPQLNRLAVATPFPRRRRVINLSERHIQILMGLKSHEIHLTRRSFMATLG